MGSWLWPLVQMHMSHAGQLAKLVDACDPPLEWELFALAVLSVYQSAALQIHQEMLNEANLRSPWELPMALQVLAAMMDPHGVALVPASCSFAPRKSCPALRLAPKPING